MVVTVRMSEISGKKFYSEDDLKIVEDLTSTEFVSSPESGCPAVFKTNNKSYVLIGKRVDAKKLGISERVNLDGEIAIEVPKELIDGKKGE